jgi:hypothetical protein
LEGESRADDDDAANGLSPVAIAIAAMERKLPAAWATTRMSRNREKRREEKRREEKRREEKRSAGPSTVAHSIYCCALLSALDDGPLLG